MMTEALLSLHASSEQTAKCNLISPRPADDTNLLQPDVLHAMLSIAALTASPNAAYTMSNLRRPVGRWKSVGYRLRADRSPTISVDAESSLRWLFSFLKKTMLSDSLVTPTLVPSTTLPTGRMAMSRADSGEEEDLAFSCTSRLWSSSRTRRTRLVVSLKPIERSI